MTHLGPAPAPANDPLGEALFDLGTRLDPSWFLLALIVPVAIMVVWYGNRQLASWRRADAFEPKGRARGGERLAHRAASPAWIRTRARLREAPPVAIAEAKAGPARVEGVVVAATETLGGPPEHGCVWRNRKGAPPASAVAATAIVLADDTGKCGVERLDQARVFAPVEPLARGHDSLALYVGDRVEVLGTFVPQRVGDDPDPAQNIYGTLGSTGPLEIQVLDRPWAAQPTGGAQPDDADREPTPPPRTNEASASGEVAAPSRAAGATGDADGAAADTGREDEAACAEASSSRREAHDTRPASTAPAAPGSSRPPTPAPEASPTT